VPDGRGACGTSVGLWERLREIGQVLLRSCYLPLSLPEIEVNSLAGPPVFRGGPEVDLEVRVLCATLLRNGRVPRKELSSELKPEVEWRLRSLGVVLYRTRRCWRIAWQRNVPLLRETLWLYKN
jgi:hypothetical protein